MNKEPILINRNTNKAFKELLNSDQQALAIIRKITFNQKITNNEYTYILSLALIFLQEFESDDKYITYFEFAYYLILKSSLINNEYRPLYDLSINYGFFPIAKKITDLELLNEEQENIADIINNKIIEDKFTQNYTKTLHQYNSRKKILSANMNHISYSAPTSFGKSEVIFSHLDNALKHNDHLMIGIITPTRSLLAQTHRQLKEYVREKKIKLIQHDEMLKESDKQFIAILTQERALRVLEKESYTFDILYIDEAHNIFDNDDRSILLSRLIRLNHQKKPNQQIVYLSPVIQNAESLSLTNIQNKIHEIKITSNIKEFDIYEYQQTSKKVYKYNRYFIQENNNDDWLYGQCDHYVPYILQNLKHKNFFFINRPIKIEQFAKELAKFLPDINEKEHHDLSTLVKEISTITHKNFYPVDLLKKGIVYLHGKMPTFIKEYLEHCYQKYNFLKYLVANTVVLQGITLPIDNLFIMSGQIGNRNLYKHELLNLVGRVNRLNYVFNARSLHELVCPIHFVGSAGVYDRLDRKMIEQIKHLQSKLFEDAITNPLLARCQDTKKLSEKGILITKRENSIVFANPNRDIYSHENIRKVLIENNIYTLINLETDFIECISKNIKQKNLDGMDIIQKIYSIFFHKLNESFLTEKGGILKRFIRDKSSRLTIKFYQNFIENRFKFGFQARIMNMFSYLKLQKNKSILQENPSLALFYMGTTYGEIDEMYEGRYKAYIDLNQKNDIELINYAIVKLKIEDDFIDFEINNFIQTLYKLELIDEEQYNLVTYGTNNLNTIELIKIGLTSEIRILLDEAQLLDHIHVNEFGILEVTDDKYDEFMSFKHSLSNMQQYELDKIL